MTHYEHCAADGCLTRPQQWSRYCQRHRDMIRRTGSPSGRVLRKHELKPWREIAAGWVNRNREHPAVLAACDFLAEMIQPQEGARFLAVEFERLRAASVAPQDMLAAIVAVWALQEASREALDDECFDVNLGRAVLRCAPQRVVSRAKSGRVDHKRVRGSHARALGQQLRMTLGALPLVAARQIVGEVLGPEQTAERIRNAMAEPFADPTTTEDHG